ncbi:MULTISPECIES: hypothetical protein [Actinoplanes]|uniref:hypothetical protein n=1 Tax=Actinoplanes TaxID=1865 RepID=UPI0005F2A889|nr:MULTISPECIES: hypothetical protein [Actinoplanes]GLY02947.1 hypothetical protein Acsp01_33260 [Actinoplanes sp. NBRC 101535]
MNTGETEPNDLVPLLLEICEDFLAQPGPPVHREVDDVLHAHGITGGPGWLIDMLALSRLRLQNTDDGPKPSSGPC